MKFDTRTVEYIKTNRDLRYAVKIVHWFNPDETNPDKPFIHKNMFGLPDDYFNKEQHRWNVYLIVFKDCKIYESLKNVLDDPNSIHRYEHEDGTITEFNCAYANIDEIFDFNWHCGATYMNYSINDFIQIGDDYSHLNDEYEMNSDSIPDSVSNEAENLYNYTENKIKSLEVQDA